MDINELYQSQRNTRRSVGFGQRITDLNGWGLKHRFWDESPPSGGCRHSFYTIFRQEIREKVVRKGMKGINHH